MGIGSDFLFHGGGAAVMRRGWTSEADQEKRRRERTAAVISVAGARSCRDADDLTLLLEHLGLDPADARTTT
jgi:hypothetical protein